MLSDNVRIFKQSFYNADKELRKRYYDHFYSAPLSIKTFLRVYSQEHNEPIYDLNYERMITAWCRFNHTLLKWIRDETNESIMTPILSLSQLTKFIFRMDNITGVSKNLDLTSFVVFELLPWKIEEFSLYNENLFFKMNEDTIQNNYNNKLLKYIETFLRNAMNDKDYNSFSMACLILLLYINLGYSPEDECDLCLFAKPYINYLSFYRMDFAKSLEKCIETLNEKYINNEIDELEILQNINDIDDNDTELYFSRYDILHESMYKDIVTFSSNEYQIFGEKVYDGTETKFIYQIEKLTPEEIWHYMGSDVRADFELTEDMLSFLRYNMPNIRQCILRSKDGHIRRYISNICGKVFLLFRIYNDAENIYGITLSSKKDENNEEYKDILQIKMDNADYKLKAGEIHDIG